MTDVLVRDEGTVIILFPATDMAKEWMAENIGDDASYFGRGLVVEHRYFRDIADGLLGDGLTIEAW